MPLLYKKGLEMNGNRYLIDTNIAIYLLAGDLKVAELLDQSHVYISFISELELRVFKQFTKEEEDIVRTFLNDIIIFDINAKIKEDTIEIRKTKGLKLPDAIIAATAKFLNLPVLTADTNFKKVEDPQIIIYSPE